MKPYIISHMMESVDGRIDCDMTEQIDPSNAYYEVSSVTSVWKMQKRLLTY